VYRVVVELRDDRDNVLGRLTTLPLAGRFATTQMEVGLAFRDDYSVPVSTTVRTLAHVYVGWYLQKPPYTVSHVTSNGAANAPVGLVKVRGPAPLEQKPPIPFTSTLGTFSMLEGYDVQGDSLTLFWRSRSATAQDWTVFVHVLDANGQTIANGDLPPAYPTSLWDEGEQVITTHHLTGLANASAVSVGLYDSETGERVGAFRPDGTPWPDNAIVVPLRQR
jgi:hypothetical protein